MFNHITLIDEVLRYDARHTEICSSVGERRETLTALTIGVTQVDMNTFESLL